ncbi:DUF3915 family protein [Bacillus arachidis]|uniref:DUF3915 family protein n=1 Tax=Bacillus arachidis TaxID=2819290 RepID=A0ABS3NVZ8_9BACI|nr:DUF3915 family protein [Bacillus arachidis]MBO1624722.1 DUF3915 family protein [Bacillus arachidis]
MFGSFGCHEDFRHFHCDRDRDRDREREKEKEKEKENNAVCNVLRNISIGTEISLLSIRNNGTFHNVIFEGFSNGVALFSALAMGNDKDNKDDKNNQHANRFTGILRVCPNDVVAIAI